MSDDEKALDELRAKAAVALAKQAAESVTPRKRSKLMLQVAIGSLVVVGLIGLMLHFWYWSLLLGLVGVAGFYGRYRWRARRASRKKPEAPALKARVEVDAAPAVVATDDASSVDDELAELKARLKQ